MTMGHQTGGHICPRGGVVPAAMHKQHTFTPTAEVQA